MDIKSGLRAVPSRGYPREGTALFYLNKMVYFWIETLVYFSIEINTHRRCKQDPIIDYYLYFFHPLLFESNGKKIKFK